MRQLIKVMLILAAVFATTFIAGRVLGILTVENVRYLLEQVQLIDARWVAAAVIALLFIDIFVAVPTLTITILAGFFLGFPLGALSALAGVSAAALTGYGLSRRWGGAVLRFLVRDETDREELRSAFQQSGPVMIMLSRAAPMVPEVTACMAGVTRMPLGRYLLFFLIGTLPYVLIGAYAGSVSSVESPQPAIYAALFLYAVLWVGWYFFRRARRAKPAHGKI